MFYHKDLEIFNLLIEKKNTYITNKNQRQFHYRNIYHMKDLIIDACLKFNHILYSVIKKHFIFLE